jgi:hypothetical protein
MARNVQVAEPRTDPVAFKLFNKACTDAAALRSIGWIVIFTPNSEHIRRYDVSKRWERNCQISRLANRNSYTV